MENCGACFARRLRFSWCCTRPERRLSRMPRSRSAPRRARRCSAMCGSRMGNLNYPMTTSSICCARRSNTFLSFIRKTAPSIFISARFPAPMDFFRNLPRRPAGFTQQIVNVDGSVGTISPFLIPQTVKDAGGNAVPLYPADTDTVDHSHAGINNSLDFDAGNVAHNDRYALNEEGLTTGNGQIVSLRTGMPETSPPKLADKQKAQLVMSHIDCDTVPFLWQYADRFTLFDNFHQTIIGPSTPNAIALIAGQSGETQWALHPAEAGDKAASSEPVVATPALSLARISTKRR